MTNDRRASVPRVAKWSFLALTAHGLFACGPSHDAPAPTPATTVAAPAAPTVAAPPPAAPVAAAPAAPAAPAVDPFAVPPVGPAPACALPAQGAADRATMTALRGGTATLADADRLVSGCNASAADIASAVEHGALAHHRQSEFEVSAAWFAKAANIDPSSLGIRFNLMCALSRLDRMDAAYVQLDALRAAGAAGEHLVARVETDPDLAAVRVDARYYDHRAIDAFRPYQASETQAPEDAVFLFGSVATPELGAPLTLTEVVPPPPVPRSPFQVSRIQWGKVRDELQLPRTSELELLNDPTTGIDVGEPLASLVRIERVTFWRPLANDDSPVFLIVPETTASSGATLSVYRIADGTARRELQERDPPTFNPSEPPLACAVARNRAGTAVYFWHGERGMIRVSEIAYSGGRVRSRFGAFLGEVFDPVPATDEPAP